MPINRRLVGCYALMVCGAAGALAAQDDEINWLGSYKEAIRQARETQKPILVEFRCEA